MSDHKHGEMDISVQEKTFDGFIKTIIWISGFSAAVLVLLAIVGT
ncbi:MAG: aa3-type cytochrome c oxidase subunit IV [Pikeienuella sp.]